MDGFYSDIADFDKHMDEFCSNFLIDNDTVDTPSSSPIMPPPLKRRATLNLFNYPLPKVSRKRKTQTTGEGGVQDAEPKKSKKYSREDCVELMKKIEKEIGELPPF